jgi:phosphate transport system substrate-binding protein
MNKLLVGAVAVLSAGTFASTTAFAGERKHVSVAGSSTVLPYANIVAEEFKKAFPKFKTVVASGGSSKGIKLFCQGLGEATIDVANASRKIKDKEVKKCADKGVKEIIEVRFGYDGIVFARDAKSEWKNFALTPKDVYLALANVIPVDGKLVENPNKTWDQVNPAFPKWKITAYIPGENHGTREVFEKKVMHAGCKAVGGEKLHKAAIVAAGKVTAEKKIKKAAGKLCYKVRTDGASVDIAGDYTETLGRIDSNKQGIGVFGLSFYENNTDKLKVATMSGISPSVETISTGKYPVSRPLYFYVKKAHIGKIPGLKEYMEFFTSEKMIGEDGPLAEYGLVPMPKNEFDELNAAIKAQNIM